MPVPCVRLANETLLVSRGSGLVTEHSEVDAAVIQLSFDYGGMRVRAADPLDRVMGMQAGVRTTVVRDRAREAQAQYLLESFGAVDLSCLDDYATLPGSKADYLVTLEDDVHALCSFSAYVLPQLKQFGWRVEIDPAYRYQIVEMGTPWYAHIEPDQEENADWFALELGVEVDGQRINLLPALVELIEKSPELSLLEAVPRSSRRFIALPVDDGRYLPLPPERLQTLVRVLLELYGEQGEQGSVRFSMAAAASLAHLEDAFGGDELRWKGAVSVRERGKALASGPAPREVAQPDTLQATLRSYQQEGLSWLQHLREHEVGGILADDMGLGKTLQTIAHLTTEKDSGRMDVPSLVVTPTSLVGNWQREIRKFAPHLKVLVQCGARRHEDWGKLADCDVLLTTYPLVGRDLEHYEGREFHYLILDEAQTIKNVRSQAHRAVKQIQARHRLCLTGTPVENNLEELWSLFDFLMPGLLGDAETFRTMFRTPIERQGSESRLQALRERVAPYIMRRMKDQVAPELPPKTEIVRPVEIAGSQRELYESIRVAAHTQVRTAIRRKGLAGSTIAILDALMKLRQVCCDPRLVGVGSARKVEGSAKYELLLDMVQKQLGQKRRILIFSQFTSMLALISDGLKRADIGHVALTGATANRQKHVDAFEQGKADVFLISLKAGGTGLNLTSADTVIHYDPWWNPAAQAQATDRAYRIGQKRPVFVYNLIVAGSVEERMLRLQRRKKHLADTILGQAGQSSTSLSETELEELFAPLDGGEGE